MTFPLGYLVSQGIFGSFSQDRVSNSFVTPDWVLSIVLMVVALFCHFKDVSKGSLCDVGCKEEGSETPSWQFLGERNSSRGSDVISVILKLIECIRQTFLVRDFCKKSLGHHVSFWHRRWGVAFILVFFSFIQLGPSLIMGYAVSDQAFLENRVHLSNSRFEDVPLPGWLLPFPELKFQRCLGHCAVRIGEADHPGPRSRRQTPMQLNIAIVNPTSVSSKLPTFLELFEKVGVQVVTLAETAATVHVQRQLSKKLSWKNILSVWSPPATPLRESISDRFCERGKPTGTAILSKVPCRPARLHVGLPWSVSPRVVHAIVQLGHSHVQLFSIYGFAHSQCNPKATQHTDELLQFVRRQIDQVPLPFVICGDFNLEPRKLPSWHSFSQIGATDLAEIHRHLYACDMPPTCNGATRPDTAIVSKELVPYISCIRVLGSEWFATHNPVVCTITLPGQSLFVRRIRLPQSWCEFGPSTEQLQEAFHTLEGASEVSSLEQWGNTVDRTVDAWLRSQNSDYLPKHLPKKYRGRCQEVKVRNSPIFSPLKKASAGAFEPPDEILTIATKRHVTQIRRITSLKQRLRHETELTENSPKFKGLLDEWCCILRAPVMAKYFAFWIAQQPELGNPPWPLPTCQWLEDLLSLTQHHLRIAMAHDRKVFNLKAKVAQQTDNKYQGSKRAFSCIRGSPKAPVNQLIDIHDCQVDADWDPGSRKVHCQGNAVDQFQLATPIEFQGISGVIVARSQGKISVQFQDLPTDMPARVQLVQKVHVFAPGDVAQSLSAYWVPLWTLPRGEQESISELDHILPHLPPQEPVTVDLTLENLKTAIARLRPNSALGVDGISASEFKLLPDGLLLLLLKVFQQYPWGFPRDFMTARTFPLNKVEGVPTNSQTRPITVLAQVYRVWGSMICHQILRQWGQRFPKQITGFLPKRGALIAAYGAQVEIELDSHTGTVASGLTLDLKKCFNLIRHAGVFRLLKWLHLPVAILQQWIGSVQNLSRFWVIENAVFGPYNCNNGLPEGDVFSVVAMLGIGLCWTSHALIETQANAVVWAYADNWAWKVYQVELHNVMLRATTAVVAAFGLVIDFGKTWYWASTNQVALEVKTLLEVALPDTVILRKEHAKDLGVEMHYSGPNRLGHTKARFQEGFDRLSRLAKLNVALSIKEHLLEASVWPAALFGSEFYPVPNQTLMSLRSSAADAVLGSAHSMNPAIALLLCGKRVLDPSFTCILSALRTARTWLLQQDVPTQDKFFRCVALASGRPQDVKGPASALQAYLHRINWKLTSTGHLQVSALQDCHLLKDSFQRVFRFLTHAWQDDFFVLYSQRKSLHSLRPPSRVDTVAILKSLDDTSRKATIREISGAYQLASQKAKWLPDTTNACKFCQGEDSRLHRLVECPVFHSIREPFLPLLQQLQDLEHPMLFCPMILRHPDCEAHLGLHAVEPVASICQEAINRSHRLQALGLVPKFYTDGSCSYPSCPTSRHSGFAVIMDLATSDQHRTQQADLFLVTQTLPNTFQQVAIGKTRGEQTIGRAELQALLVLISAIPRCEVFSDSVYALGILTKFQQGASLDSFCDKDNLDLIAQASILDLSQVILRKIKAHTSIKDISCPISRYQALGNSYADVCAGRACADHNLPWDKALQQKHQDLQTDRDFFRQLCTLHVALHRARQDVELQVDPLESFDIGGSVGKTPHQKQRELIDWSPESGVAYDSTFVPVELRRFFLFGETWLNHYQQWLGTLQWETGQTPPFGDIGITWLELGLSFSRFAGAILPIVRNDSEGVAWLISPTEQQYDKYDILALDMATAAMQFWNAYHSLMLGGPPISLTRGLQNSPYILGHRSQASGIKPRPWMVHSDEVIPFAASILDGKSSYQSRIILPWSCCDTNVPAMRWDSQKKALKVGQAGARRLKKASGDL